MRKTAILWVLSLIVVGALSAAVMAQVSRQAPRVITGADLGFRVDGQDRLSLKPTGTLVIKINGEWVEVTSAFSAVPATR